MANFAYNIPVEVQRGIAMHFEMDVPIVDLDLTKPQKTRLTRVKAIYMAWLSNPYINPLEMSRSMLKAESSEKGNRTDAGNLLNAAKKDVEWFKWVQKHYLELPSRKELQYKGLRTADDMIIAGREAGNWLTVNDGLKQMYKFGGLDRPEEDPQHVNDAAYQELIPTTDVTKVDPDRKRISVARRKELASKWGAHIDEHGVLIDKDGKVVGGQPTRDAEETEAAAMQQPTEPDEEE